MCGDSEAAARLKQLELESSPLLAAPRNNMNVNVAMNNQASVCVISSACFDGDQQHFCVVHWQFSINKHMCGTAWWSLCDIWPCPNRTMWWSSQRSAGWTVRAAVHAWLRCAPRRTWRVTSWRLKLRRPLSRCATDRGVKKWTKRARRRRREPSDVLWFCLSIRVKASSADWAVFS